MPAKRGRWIPFQTQPISELLESCRSIQHSTQGQHALFMRCLYRWLDWTYQGSHQGKLSGPFSALLHLQCCPFSLGGFIKFSSHHNSLSLGKPSFKINQITIIKRMMKIKSGDCLEVATMENDASTTHLCMWIKWKYEFYWLSSFSLFKLQHIFASFFWNNDDGLAVL